MKLKVEELIEDCDIFIAAAAVSDFKPKEIYKNKIKKNETEKHLNLKMDKNSDILKVISEKNLNLKTVGFAAETENLLSNAKKKLSQKKLDLIVPNDVSNKDIGFDSDENEVTLITKKEQKKIKKASKKIVSKKIVEFIASRVVND